LLRGTVDVVQKSVSLVGKWMTLGGQLIGGAREQNHKQTHHTAKEKISQKNTQTIPEKNAPVHDTNLPKEHTQQPPSETPRGGEAVKGGMSFGRARV